MKLKTLEVVSYERWFQPAESRGDLYAARRNAFHRAADAERFTVPPPDVASDDVGVSQLYGSGGDFHLRFSGGEVSAGPLAMLSMADVCLKSDCGTVFIDEHIALGESYHDPWVFGRILGQPCSHVRVDVDYDAGGMTLPFTAKVYLAPDGPVQEVPGPYVSLVSRWADNYAHWMLEVLPRLWYRDRYPELRDVPILVPPLTRPFQRETLEALGVAGQCVPYENAFVRFGRLYFPGFAAPGGFARRQVEWLRGALGVAASGPGRRRLFVSRQGARGRHVQQFEAVERFLLGRGFETVVLDALSVRDQARLFAEAEMVVSPHGAANANLAFLPEGAAFVELLPRSVMHPMYWILAKLAKCRYGAVFCADSGAPLFDLAVEVDALAAVLDGLGRNQGPGGP